MIVKLHDKSFRPYICQKQIQQQVERLATEVYHDLKNERPIFVAFLNGAFMFAADFMKAYKGECEISFVRLASYEGMKSSGNVKQITGLSTSVKGRNVVVLEDIVDTGNTLQEIFSIFEQQEVKSLRVVTLFFKPEAYKKNFPIHHIGFSIPNQFIVGYGLDYDEIGRNLPQIYQLNTNNMTNLVLFGKPGAGKGTQAVILKDKYNLIHISTGDLFRNHIKNQTQLGELAKSFIDKGELVPDQVTIDILKDEIEKNPNANGFIFDGFPRTIVQAQALDELLLSKGMQIDATLALDYDDEILVQRILERGKVSGRTDDQDESKVRNRFVEYREKTQPLINYYQEQGKLRTIRGEGTIENMTRLLSEEIDKIHS